METRITPRVKTHKAWRVVRVCGPGREQPAGATSVCQSLIPGRSAGDDAVHALQHIFPMTGLSWRRTRLKRGLAARLSSCIRDRGNVGGSPTPGNHTAETALAGWGARIRTWEWRNQNPYSSPDLSGRISKNRGFAPNHIKRLAVASKSRSCPAISPGCGESTPFTREGSQVQSLSRPPCISY
jgi:hypothetical protein